MKRYGAKAILGLFVLLICMALAAAGSAARKHTSEDGQFTYALLEDGTVRIREYLGSEENLVIPETIDGYRVTAVEDLAFRDCRNLKSITFPDSVVSLEGEIFYNNTALTEVTLPAGLTVIPERMFCGCTNLASIHFPDGLTAIGDHAFSKCRNLTFTCFPESLTTIGAMAFSECDSLTELTFPDHDMEIGLGAFQRCRNLARVALPGKGTKYEGITFGRCEALKDVVFPEGITSLDLLKSLTLSGLTEFTIPDGVTAVEDETFYAYYTSLEKVVIPDSVTSIGAGAFAGCSSLKEINIPDSVTSIGKGAFSGCGQLTEIHIPDGVAVIGEETFSECAALTSVSIPDSVKVIGANAFSGCAALSSLTVPAGVTGLAEGALGGSPEFEVSVAPESAAEAYCVFHGIKYRYTEGAITVPADESTVENSETAVLYSDPEIGIGIVPAKADNETEYSVMVTVTGKREDRVRIIFQFGLSEELSDVDGFEFLRNNSLIDFLNQRTVICPAGKTVSAAFTWERGTRYSHSILLQPTVPVTKWIDLETDIIPSGEQAGIVCLEITGQLDSLDSWIEGALSGKTTSKIISLDRMIVIRLRNDE